MLYLWQWLLLRWYGLKMQYGSNSVVSSAKQSFSSKYMTHYFFKCKLWQGIWALIQYKDVILPV